MVFTQHFFDWLDTTEQLYQYEAALDLSVDYTIEQEYRFNAQDFVEQLQRTYIHTTL